MSESAFRNLYDSNFSETAQHSGYIVCQTERVEISKEFCSLQLNPERFPRTPKLLIELYKRGIETVGQLPSTLEELIELPSVGTVAVLKFFDHLKELLLCHHQLEVSIWTGEVERNTVQQLGYIMWEKERVDVHEEDFLLELDPSKYVKAAKLVDELDQSGIRTIGELPAKFENLLQYKSVGRAMVTRFLEQYKYEASVHQKQLARERYLNSLSEEERINVTLLDIEAKWKDWAAPEVAKHSSDRAVQMLYYRWKNKRNGKHATLEETGAAFNVSRERVRQIIVKKLKRLQTDLLELMQMIRVACGEQRYFMYMLRNDHSFIQDVIVQALSFNNLIYIEKYKYWTTDSSSQIDSTFKEIKIWSQLRYKGIVITPTMLSNDCKEYASIHMVPEDLVISIVKDTLKDAGSYGYILSSSHKYDIVEMVIRAFPEGVEIHGNSAQLLAMANEISNGQFNSKREVTSALLREELRAIVYMWGSGKYIHHSYVHVDLSLIREIIRKVGALSKKAHSMHDFFDKESVRLQQAGVPNEHVLYGVIKRHCSDLITHCIFPMIWLK